MEGGNVVFGGSGGLGQAVVRKLAERGPVQVGFFSKPDKAEALVAEVQKAGGKAHALQVDMRDPASVQNFLEGARKRMGRVAGIASVTGPAIPLRPLADVGLDEFKRILETDVIGSFNVLKAAVPMLKDSGGGAIVMFVTTAVLRVLENDGMSSTPKFGVAGLVRLMAREAGPYNVRVNAIAPGVIDAGIVHESFTTDEVAMNVIKACMAATPMGRMGRPEEIAALTDFLLSPGAGYVSGQVIACDGAYSA